MPHTLSVISAVTIFAVELQQLMLIAVDTVGYIYCKLVCLLLESREESSTKYSIFYVSNIFGITMSYLCTVAVLCLSLIHI